MHDMSSDPDQHVQIPYTLICCRFRNRYLMVKRLKPPYVGHWNFLGGKIEPGEKLLYSAQRELQEEAGLSVEIERIKFRGVIVWPNERRENSLLGMFLFAVVLNRQPIELRQMAFQDEGTTGWLSDSEILNRSVGPVVPNASILLPYFTGLFRQPKAVFHYESALGDYHVKETTLRSGLQNPDDWPVGPARMEATELFSESLEDIMIKRTTVKRTENAA